MTFTYDRAYLKARVNAGIQNRMGSVPDPDQLMDDCVRAVLGSTDIRSSIRKAALTPKLFNGVTSYTAPTDLKEQGIIDVPPQVKRSGNEWFLTTPSEFERIGYKLDGWIAIDHFNGTPKILLAKNLEDENRVIAELDSITSGGGTWVSFGDAINVEADHDDYIKGGGSLSFDLSGVGGTTAGLQNLSLEAFDIEDFLDGNGAAFTWVKFSDATDITNLILRLGTDVTGNYVQKIATVCHDGTAFQNGWNLIRFDLTSLTEAGTAPKTGLDSVAIYMTKASGKINETDYKFDWLVLKRGQIYEQKYYSRFGWVDANTGAYKEFSDDDSDLIVCDTTEFELFMLKGRQLAAQEINEFDMANSWRVLFEGADGKGGKRFQYLQQNPSEKKIMTTEYHAF